MSILYDYPTLENEHDETITQIHAFIDRMTRISQHHSSGSFYSGDNGVLQDLMSKASIRGNLTGFVADIAVVKQTLRTLGDKQLLMPRCARREQYCRCSIVGLDYALFAGQLSVTRLYFHQGIGYKYNFIQSHPF